MKTLSKRLLQEHNKVDKTAFYDIKEGVSLVKKTATAKFNESIEAHISLNIDPKYADQQLRTTVILPHGTGKTIRIGALFLLIRLMRHKILVPMSLEVRI